MSNLFWTSDHHFNHRNVIRHDNESLGKIVRPFENELQMNEHMIEKWNSVVSTNDIVYHLGDCFWRTTKIEDAEYILARLNGRKHLMLGNHREVDQKLKAWASIEFIQELMVPDDSPECSKQNGRRLISMQHLSTAIVESIPLWRQLASLWTSSWESSG